MPPRVGHWLLVALLVTGSGCAGLTGGDSDVTTATPVPVPTERPPLSPGVSTDGVVDAGELGAANERVLDEESYELDRTVTVSGSNGTVRIERVQRGTAEGVIVARLSVSGDGPVDAAVENWTRYRESDVVWSRTTLPGGRTVRNRLPARNATAHFVGRALPERLFSAGTYEVGRTSEGDLTLRSTTPFDLDRSVTDVRTGPPRNVSVRAVVTERGLVREIDVTYTANVGSETVRVRIVQSVSLLESADVERPAWVSEAE